MAHPNIDERRAAVQEALKIGPLDGNQRRMLAAHFGCTTGAICADVLHFTHPRTYGQTYHLSAEMRRRIIARDGGVCQYCGCTPKAPIIEHIIPTCQGGLSTLANLVAACQSCNMKKRYIDRDSPAPEGTPSDKRRETLLALLNC